MNLVGRYILNVRLESTVPSHLRDLETWRCEKCAKSFVDIGDGETRETEQLPKEGLF
jgi:hypothetical protein